MNWNQIEGNWKQLKGSAKQRWSKLNDDRLGRIEGKRTELVGELQEAYGITQEEAEAQVDEFASEQDGAKA